MASSEKRYRIAILILAPRGKRVKIGFHASLVNNEVSVADGGRKQEAPGHAARAEAFWEWETFGWKADPTYMWTPKPGSYKYTHI